MAQEKSWSWVYNSVACVLACVMMVMMLGGCATQKKLPQDAVASQTVPIVPGPGYYRNADRYSTSHASPSSYYWSSRTGDDTAMAESAAGYSPSGGMTQGSAQVEGIKIGLLIPLSGKQAALGQAMQNAAQLAVMDSGADINLLPRDSGDGAGQAQAALRSLMAEGAQFVVGPLYGAQARAVRADAQSAQIPVFSFSNDPGVASAGVYAMGFNPGEQIERVIEHTARQGHARFVAFLPANSYGGLVELAYLRAVKASGATSISIVRYGSGAAALATGMTTLAKLKGQFDALLLPETGIFSVSLIKQMMAQGIDFSTVKVLGSGQWEDLSASDLPQGVTAMFAAPEDDMRQRFGRDYTKNFGASPPRLASLAYDAVAMLGALRKMGRPLDNSQFQTQGGFSGVDGLFRLTSAGLAERRLAIYQLQDGARSMVSGAGGF